MGKFLTTFKKELLLLFRDRTGIALLFAMPAVLVLVVCLVQEKVLNPVTNVLVLDKDKGVIGRVISEGVTESENLKVTMAYDVDITEEGEAKQAVNKGEYQFSIVIPKGSSDFAMEKAVEFAALSARGGAGPGGEGAETTGGKKVVVYFDPSVQGGFRAAVLSSVSRVLALLEYRIKLDQALSAQGAADAKGVEGKDPLPWFGIEEIWATEFGFVTMPTSVQQNVPAWALFGIFFICVPLSGSLIKERDNKTLDRLRSMPVSGVVLMAGKISAYVLVCMVQFFMIFLIGKFILPLLGAPAFSVGTQILAVILIVLATAMAATGYGILLGTLARTHEQAVVLGPISIVIAAALGGIMVPVYLMPEPMQVLSNISPLAWALDAFYDIFLRGNQLEAVMPETAGLFAFSAATLTVAHVAMKIKN